MRKRSSLSFFLGIGLGAFVLALVEALLEVHFPGTDVFLFKEAGVNLATQGKFVAANLPHTPFGEERAFAYYPPLYPFVFGVWSWLVGVGLQQSIFFDALLRILRTFLMVVLIYPTFSKDFFTKKERYFRWTLGIFFCLLTLASTDRDRPDELAIIFGLLLLVTVTSKINSRIKVIGAGFFLACVGASSPACGIFFSGLAAIWAISNSRRYLLGLGILGSAVCFGLVLLLPVLLEDGASGIRFSKQAGISTFPYLRFTDWKTSWQVIFGKFLYFLKIFRATSPQFWWLGLMLSFSFLVARFTQGKEIGNEPFSIWALSSIGFGILVPMVWTLQPYYLWFSCIVLIIWFIRWMAVLEKSLLRKVFLGLLFSFLSPFWVWEAKCFVNALQMPKMEARSEIKNAVLKEIKPGTNLAVTHDQYFTFRKDRPVINYEYWGWNPKLFDYLYVTDLPDSQQLQPRGRQILSNQTDGCFTLVKDFSTKTPLKILGYETRYFVRGHGGSLLKNNCKRVSERS